jgi:Cupredoxin-like domain
MRLRVIRNNGTNPMRLRPSLLLLVLLGATQASAARAEDPPEIAVTFLGDRFEPTEISVPTAVKFALRVENKSTVSMEWESRALHREKIVPAGASAKISVGPLAAGSYEFFDDFHPKIRGHLVAH